MKVLITGGAGFIGCNLASFYIGRGDEVFILDDLSRDGARSNLEWLASLGEYTFIHQDITEFGSLKESLAKCGEMDAVFHFAAQVAVTRSVEDPRLDFETNARGAFNLLEAIRENGLSPVIIYSSTNKVYGEMTDLRVTEEGGRYKYSDLPEGISEERQLDFHSPYGCSKGCADQYIIDYGRIYGLRTVSLRQSCIYGSRQFGVEDQGWVAWFIIAAILGRPLTIYGDGKQVRDILHIDDLVELYDLTYENIDKVKGRAFNIGGGSSNQMSLLELVSMIEERLGNKLDISFKDWRPGDQKIYVSDINKIKDSIGWEPKINKTVGVSMLWDWVYKNKSLF